jgi:hypothetical protein
LLGHAVLPHRCHSESGLVPLFAGWSHGKVVPVLPNVGLSPILFAKNAGRKVSLFAGQPPDNCGPLHLG